MRQGPLEPGTRVGPYTILAPLGAGGMGEVFRARDTRLGREVALKILPFEFSFDPERLRRFELEARAASALNHPNLLTIYDVGTHQDLPYLVCELLSGRTLRQVLQTGPVPLASLVSWGRDLVSGLAAAHAKGIVHRDLKPENIFVTEDGRVKILDFGLAKLRPPGGEQASAEPHAASTDTGMVLGTMGYMSPEQARGERVDHRTDIFSLGAVLYEMATGRAAFPGQSLASLVAVLNEEPPPVSAIQRDFPPALEAVIARCLAKAPQHRFQSAPELSRALDRPVAGAVRGSGSRRWTLALVALAALLAGAALVVLATRGRKAVLDNRTVAVEPFVNTSGDSTQNFLADGVTDGLAVALSQIGSLKVVALQDSASLGDLRRLHGVRAVVRGSVSRSGDTVRVEARLLDAGSRGTLWEDQVAAPLGRLPQHHGSLAVAISRALHAELRRDERARLGQAGEIDRVAYEAFLRGRFALEQGELELARGQFERAATIAPAWAPPHVGLANYWTSLSFFSDLPPADVLPRARDEVTRALELDQTLAEAHAVLGYLRAYYEWDWRAAEVEYRRALALQPSNSQAYFSYSRFLASRGRLDQAIEQIRKAVEFDPLSLELKANVALLHYFAGHYDSAAAGLEEIRRVNPNYVLGGWALGLVYEQQGRAREAVALLEAVAGRSLNRLSSLGHSYGLVGRRGEARAILDTLRVRARSTYVPAYWFALVHAGLGDTAATLESLERAYQERSTVLAYLRIDPRLGLVRDQPRFIALARRVAGDTTPP